MLVDGTDIQRQIIPVRRLQLTSQIVKIGRGSRTGKLRTIISKENVAKKFEASSIGKSFARQQRRQSLTDFERHKVLVLRRKLSKLTRAKPKKWSVIPYLNFYFHNNSAHIFYIHLLQAELQIMIKSRLRIYGIQIMRWDFCCSLVWMLRPVRCRWCNAWHWWRKAVFQLKWCIPNPTRPAWRFRLRPRNRDRDQQESWCGSRLSDKACTLLVGSAEVVLHCLDYVRLNILLLFEGDGSSIHQLSILIVCQSWGACCRFGCCLRHFVGESEPIAGFEYVSQHLININSRLPYNDQQIIWPYISGTITHS